MITKLDASGLTDDQLRDWMAQEREMALKLAANGDVDQARVILMAWEKRWLDWLAEARGRTETEQDAA